jgi:hypothetical protein
MEYDKDKKLRDLTPEKDAKGGGGLDPTAKLEPGTEIDPTGTKPKPSGVPMPPLAVPPTPTTSGKV